MSDDVEQSDEERIDRVVRERGWYPLGVRDHDPPFLYTIGLMSSFRHPEWIMLGLELENIHALFSAMIERLRDGQTFLEPGVRSVTIDDDEHRIALRRVHPTRHPQFLGYAMGYCRHIGRWGDLEAIQVFWPDDEGRFPFDAGCDLEVHSLQPRLDIALTPRELRAWERQWE
jgi:hypothetical protein